MCEHRLGRLPCTNKHPHLGESDDSGRGCTHDAGSGIANAPKEDDPAYRPERGQR